MYHIGHGKTCALVTPVSYFAMLGFLSLDSTEECKELLAYVGIDRHFLVGKNSDYWFLDNALHGFDGCCTKANSIEHGRCFCMGEEDWTFHFFAIVGVIWNVPHDRGCVHIIHGLPRFYRDKELHPLVIGKKLGRILQNAYLKAGVFDFTSTDVKRA